MGNDFLKSADDPNLSFLSESKLIEQLQKHNKAIVLSSDSLAYIHAVYFKIRTAIENQKTAQMVHYHVNADCTWEEKILSVASITETEILNIVIDAFNNEYNGYIFIVDRGLQCLLLNGKYSYEVETYLEHTESSKRKLGECSPVSALPAVFDHFLVDCRHGVFYGSCFQSDGKIKETILEQELRNILMTYLSKKVRGSVQSEFCTDYKNDKESVDIYIEDGKESAIIEVKFAFSSDYYAGKTFYNINKRAKEGYEQLNKYAIHLVKDMRRVESGYLYIFHMTEKTEVEIRKDVCGVLESLKNELSPEFKSMYNSTVYNDMHTWKA